MKKFYLVRNKDGSLYLFICDEPYWPYMRGTEWVCEKGVRIELPTELFPGVKWDENEIGHTLIKIILMDNITGEIDTVQKLYEDLDERDRKNFINANLADAEPHDLIDYLQDMGFIEA